jgi:hypothetical protein
MSRRGRILGLDSIDTEQALKQFVKSAETTMDLSASAKEHMDAGDCRNASLFAMRAAEEVGAARGVMQQVALEVHENERDIRRVGRKSQLLEQKARLDKTLSILREDFDFLQAQREALFHDFASRCACAVPDAVAPGQVTTRPSDGEEDG